MTETKMPFRCVIISPAGKLLDCSVSSVTFTAHDGSIGILHNHMPMLCELGTGIIEITLENNNNGNVEKKLAFIDGGFALVGSNLVNIIASDAVCGWDINKEKIELLLEKSKKKLSQGVYGNQQKLHEIKRNTLLQKLSDTIK